MMNFHFTGTFSRNFNFVLELDSNTGRLVSVRGWKAKGTK